VENSHTDNRRKKDGQTASEAIHRDENITEDTSPRERRMDQGMMSTRIKKKDPTRIQTEIKNSLSLGVINLFFISLCFLSLFVDESFVLWFN